MQRTNCLKQTNKQQQRIKTVLSTYAVAQKKKKIPPKMSLIRVRTQTTALPVQGSNHWASKPTASWSFFIFIFVLEAFFLLLLSCVFNCDHFLCIYFWFKYMKFINSSLQISSGKLFVAFTKYNKAMFVKLSTSFSIPLRANLLRFPFLLV